MHYSPPIPGSRGFSAEDNNNAAPATPDADNNVSNNNNNNNDDQLVDWLRGLSLSQDTIQRVITKYLYTNILIKLTFAIYFLQFVDEDLSYADVSSLMSREDLRRLGLRAGPEIRVWRAILDLRGHRDQGPQEEPQEGHKDD